MAVWHADFSVGEWDVRPKLNQISTNGQSVTVKHKSMAVLACLADADGEVVTRQQILDSVWPRMHVTDDVLTQSIVELRKAFDDDAKHPQVIETIPRIGFRLLAPVLHNEASTTTMQGPSASVTIPRHERKVVYGAIVLFVAVLCAWYFFDRADRGRNRVVEIEERPSIAVLPFDYLSDNVDHAFLAEGLADEIRNLFAKTRSLHVIGRSSSEAFESGSEKLRTIGPILGVNYLLEGTVLKVGDSVRISAQLVDVSDESIIWTDSYDRELTDIFAVQDSVAAAVIDALKLEVGTVPLRRRPTEDLQAYTLFLKAGAALQDFDKQQARGLLRQAVTLDSGFAEAYELLAYTQWLLAGTEGDAVTAQERVRDAAASALAAKPDLVLARALHRASEFGPNIRFRKLQAFEEAARKRPNNPAILETLVFSLTEQGYINEAYRVAEQFIEIEPLSQIANTYWATAQYAAGDIDGALAAADFANSLDLETLEGVYIVENRTEIAAERFGSYLQANHYEKPNWAAVLIERGRDPAYGQAYLDARMPGIIVDMASIDDYDWHQGLTAFYLYLGHLDRHYELVLATQPSASTWHVGGVHLWRGHVFRRQGFTAHPRYIELARALGVNETWEQRGPPDFCTKQSGAWVCN